MSVEEKIIAALAPFGDPVEKSLLYAAAQDLPPRYYTFSCSSFGADFGDDEPGHERWLVTVHYFAPLYNEDVPGRVKKAKRALYRAGFTWPSTVDASDQEGQHIVFECALSEISDKAHYPRRKIIREVKRKASKIKAFNKNFSDYFQEQFISKNL